MRVDRILFAADFFDELVLGQSEPFLELDDGAAANGGGVQSLGALYESRQAIERQSLTGDVDANAVVVVPVLYIAPL